MTITAKEAEALLDNMYDKLGTFMVEPGVIEDLARTVVIQADRIAELEAENEKMEDYLRGHAAAGGRNHWAQFKSMG